MTNPFRERHTLGSSAPLRVGARTSSATLRRWSDSLQALAGMGTFVGSLGTRLYWPSGTASETRVTYRKAPWARYVMLAYQMPPRAAPSDFYGGVQVDFAGTNVDLPGQTTLTNGSSVDVALSAPIDFHPPTFFACWDVAGLTDHALYDFVVTTATKSLPMWGTLFEVPLGVLDPDGHPTRDPAYASASSVDSRVIETGDLTTPDGVGRLWALQELLRTGVHHHYQWGQPIGGSSPSVGTVAISSVMQLLVRPRRMTAGAAVTHKLRVRYKTAASPAGNLYIKQTPVSGGTPSTATIALPVSTSWTTLDTTWDSMATSDARLDVRFGWDDAAVAAVALIS